MARIEKNRLLNILDKRFSFLTPVLSKKTQSKWLSRLSTLYWFASFKEKSKLFPARFELATFRVWGGRDNPYTTETTINKVYSVYLFSLFWIYVR